MEFVGRQRELELLARELDKASSSLVIAYGRRRVGKSRLLLQAIMERRSVYFQATLAPSALNIQAFKEAASEVVSSPAILQGLSSWSSILEYLADESAKIGGGLIVVFDEFPYLLEDDKSLPSVVQKFWDANLSNNTNLKLILCGSAIAQMEDLLSEHNPLYGRKTMTIDVRQLSLREVAEFFPSYSAEQLVETYAVFGGIPHYLQLCDPKTDLRRNIIDLLLTETGALVDEPEFLLRSELDKPRVYAGILAAIADGCDTTGLIADRIGQPVSALGEYIGRLSRLDLIAVERSLDAHDKARNRKLKLNDRLMAFWYRFVMPHQSAINSGHGEMVYDKVVDRFLPDFMGTAFEPICREYAKLHIAEVTGVPANIVGSIWGHDDLDIDVAGTLLDKTPFFGECKWRAQQIDLAMVQLLKDRSEKVGYGRNSAGKQYFFFSKNGFRPEVEQLQEVDASVHLISLDQLVFGEIPELNHTPGSDEDKDYKPVGRHS
jgi:hypothetical protein